MQQTTNLPIVEIISAMIALAALTWGVWVYFKSRKYAELRFQITQLSDFGIPADFVKQLAPHALITILVESTGNKAAENVEVDLETANPIDIQRLGFDPEAITSSRRITEKGVHISIERLNPTQHFKLFLTCDGDPTKNQLTRRDFTHTEGKALPIAAYPPNEFRLYFAPVLMVIGSVVVLTIGVLPLYYALIQFVWLMFGFK